MTSQTGTRLPALDGLRAVSITLVLAAHLLPLGPNWLKLNSTAGLMGMALFFNLSGFLIVRFLADGMSIATFSARRLARIVPLAWTAMIVLWLAGSETGKLLPNLLFLSNLPPSQLFRGGEHLWSLCIEVQFYAVIALSCMAFSWRALWLVPVACIGVTAARVLSDQPVSIVTWHRVDEILAGGTIALVYCGWVGRHAHKLFHHLNLPLAFALLIICCHPAAGAALYFRPYAAALVLGSAIYNLDKYSERILINRPASYIAEISYALYVTHGMLTATWLGSGDKLERYLKRPVLFAVTFGLSHLSTFYLEKPFTRLARGMTASR